MAMMAMVARLVMTWSSPKRFTNTSKAWCRCCQPAPRVREEDGRKDEGRDREWVRGRVGELEGSRTDEG